jgi:chemotaxis protein methyltransferase CheR
MALWEERDDLRMTEAEFRMLCDLLRGYCGLHFGPEARYVLEKRLVRRARELGADSFTAYHYLLRHDSSGDQELARLVDELVTNETYFFRERNQLRALFEEILPDLRARSPRRSLSLWSAGCSGGEEPYTLVMLALEAGLEPGRDLRVYASDISRPMLQKARRGLYREASFRQTEPALREKYFLEKDGVWRISDDVKMHVDFIHLNLLDRSKVALLGTMDVTLCRNVIIYFGIETKQKVIQTLDEKLRPGGYLLLGHSESLINISSAFELRHLKHDLVYRKPAPGDSPYDPWHAAAAAAVARVEAGEER